MRMPIGLTEGITLAACSMSGPLQAKYLNVQVTAWDSWIVLVGWTPAGFWVLTQVANYGHASGKVTCVVPLTKTRLGDRSFAVAGPRLWSMFSASLHLVDARFKHLLKSHLFSWGLRLRPLVTVLGAVYKCSTHSSLHDFSSSRGSSGHCCSCRAKTSGARFWFCVLVVLCNIPHFLLEHAVINLRFLA